ncbi:MAG: XdhC family protein [Anaerolineales bacterium]|nr:XdhC family protein [Anaerolineales bacterium]
MRELLTDLERWRETGVPIALGTVVQTWGSSPRRPGAKIILASDGKIAGSVSGGCVEAAVAEAGLESLKTGQPQLLHFAVADETAWDVGLACGGSIDVFVKPLDLKFFKLLRTAWLDDSPSAHATIIRGPADILGREMLVREHEVSAGYIGGGWDERVYQLANEALVTGVSFRKELNEDIEVFVEAITPPPTLIMVGGVHIAVALVSLAKTLGYRTIVIDPRGAWGNEVRFPHVDTLIQAWIDEAFGQVKITSSTAIAMLTHDPKLDDPALKIALNSPAFYVGALGSKTTNEKRRERLLNEGLSELQLARLHVPIGLEIGAQTPEEIALAVMAEVVCSHRKQSQLSAENEAKVIS